MADVNTVSLHILLTVCKIPVLILNGYLDMNNYSDNYSCFKWFIVAWYYLQIISSGFQLSAGYEIRGFTAYSRYLILYFGTV